MHTPEGRLKSVGRCIKPASAQLKHHTMQSIARARNYGLCPSLCRLVSQGASPLAKPVDKSPPAAEDQGETEAQFRKRQAASRWRLVVRWLINLGAISAACVQLKQGTL